MSKFYRGALAAERRVDVSDLGNGNSALAELADALPFRLDDYAGYSYRDKPILDLDDVIEQIDSGRQLDTSDGEITYAFFNHVTALGIANNPWNGEGAGYSPLSEAEMAVARDGMELWDDLIKPDIVEITPESGASDWGQNTVDIWFANTTTGPAQAWAYYPGSGQEYTRTSSDVWTADPSVNWTNDWLSYSGYGRTTLIHEAGHALGLSHPGNYNFGQDSDGDGEPDPLTYDVFAEYAQDSEMFSIMSYWGPQETGAPLIVNWLTGFYSYAQTPMVHDILALQSIYGADTTTRTDDTVYFSNSTADREVFDLEENPFPYLSVYDAGGTDTFDFSTADAGVFIDLRPGSFSSAAADMPTAAEANAARAEMDAIYPGTLAPRTDAQMASFEANYTPVYASLIEGDTGVAGVLATSHSNISIAYGTVIENAIGSSQRDYLVGNHVANELSGNGGNDVIRGLGGDDILAGGAGSDHFVYGREASGIDTIVDFTARQDKIDLTELGRSVRWTDVTFDSATHTVTVDLDGMPDLQIVLDGVDSISKSDFLFA